MNVVAAGAATCRWGEPVLDFTQCISQHAVDRKLGKDAAYWVCAVRLLAH